MDAIPAESSISDHEEFGHSSQPSSGSIELSEPSAAVREGNFIQTYVAGITDKFGRRFALMLASAYIGGKGSIK